MQGQKIPKREKKVQEKKKVRWVNKYFAIGLKGEKPGLCGGARSGDRETAGRAGSRPWAALETWGWKAAGQGERFRDTKRF